MTVHCEQISIEEKERILTLIDNGDITIYRGASKLGIPYTTIHSRIYRGATVIEAFTTPIKKRKEFLGNAAWQALGN